MSQTRTVVVGEEERGGGRARGGGEPGASVRECTHKKFVANFVDTKGLRILARPMLQSNHRSTGYLLTV